MALDGTAAGRGACRRGADGGVALNLNQLEYFEKVYETGSYTAAAREIPMSRQGLLKALRGLESECGFEAFAPGEDGAPVVTACGEALHRFAASVRAARVEFDADVAAIRSRRRELNVCASVGIMGFLGEGFTNGFRKACPEVDLHVEEMQDLHCDEALASGAFNLALTVNPYNPSFVTQRMYLCDRWIWVNAADELARRRVLSFADMDGRHVGVMGPAFKTHLVVRDLAQAGRITPVSIDCFSEMFWLSQYAHKPGRIAVSAQHVVNLPLFAQDGCIVAKPFVGFPWGFGVSWRRGHALSAGEEAFVEHCAAFSTRLQHAEGPEDPRAEDALAAAE